MPIQQKSLPFINIKAQATGRIRTGVCSVFGNIDSYGDRVMPGAFKKTIAEGLPSQRIKHLWNHNFCGLPTAKILELKEVSRDELPQEILDYAPEAMGGLVVTREYDDDPEADAILKKIDKGMITQMSFGFDVIRAEDVAEDGRNIRELKELYLYDTSDVLWGANDATVTTGAKNLIIQLPLIEIASQFKNFIQQTEDIKAGRRNSESDQALIQQIHNLSGECGAVCEAKTEDLTETTDEEKNAEAVIDNTSLSALKLGFQKLKLGNLTN